MKYKRGYVAQPEWFLILVPVLLLIEEPLGLKNLAFVFYILMLLFTQKTFDKNGQEIPMVPTSNFWRKTRKVSKIGLSVMAFLCLFEGWILKLGHYLIETYT